VVSQNGQWEFEPVKRTERVASGTVDLAADKPGRVSLPVTWGRYRLEVSTGEANGPVTSLSFDAGFYAEANADTPDLLEVALDKPDYKPGEAMNVAVTARTAGRLTVNVFTDRLVASQSQDVKAARRASTSRSAAIGARALIWLQPCAGRSMRQHSACRAGPSACNGSRSIVLRAPWRST
jgi:Large extracellular alpha-helical protein